jgi:hypothetical protein
MDDRDDIVVVNVPAPALRRGMFFAALHRCAMADGAITRVMAALGIGPAMGTHNDTDITRFMQLASLSAYNIVSGVYGVTSETEPARRKRRMRMLDPSGWITRREVLVVLQILEAGGVPCVVHSLLDIAEDPSAKVCGKLNLWRTTSSTENEAENETENETENDDGSELDMYGFLSRTNGADDVDDCSVEGMRRAAAATLVRVPRSFMEPLAQAMFDELENIGVKGMGELRDKAKAVDVDIRSMQSVYDGLTKTAKALENDRAALAQIIVGSTAARERLEGESRKVLEKNAEMYAAILSARNDSAKASIQLKNANALASALQTKLSATAARKTALEASIQELVAAKEQAGVRAELLVAAKREMAEDRAAAEEDVLRAEQETAKAVLLAADARTTRDEAFDLLDMHRADIQAARVRSDSLQVERETLLSGVEGLLTEVEELRPRVSSLRSECDELRSEWDGLRSEWDGVRSECAEIGRDMKAARRDMVDAFARRQRAAASYEALLQDVEDLTTRHQGAVLARQHAMSACRQAEASVRAALAELKSLSGTAAVNVQRVRQERDAAVKAECDAFKLNVQRDLASGTWIRTDM